MPVTIELLSQEAQTAYNLRRWAELRGDSALARTEGKVETDRHGTIIVTPPPGPFHGGCQSQIAYLLKTLLPDGIAITECPISTSDGVRAADVAWLTRAQWEAEPQRDLCLT